MKIKSYQLHPYQIPLKKPLAAQGASSLSREVFFLQIQDHQGRVVFGEAAPLLWDQRELMAIEKELRRTGEFLKDREIAIEEVEIRPFLSKLNFPENLPAVCRFAWEMALVQLAAERTSRDLGTFLGGKGKGAHVVQVNGLVCGNYEKVLEEVQTLIAQGYRSLKIKVGGDPEKDAALVCAVRELLPDEGSLRLDPNGKWTCEKALRFARVVGREKIDYIEEPFVFPSQQGNRVVLYNEFYRESSLPFALDETLPQWDWDDLDALIGLKAIVLKPSGLGLWQTFQWVDAAQERSLRAVISSSFESSLGLSFLALVAAATFQPEVAMGLGTFTWFQEDGQLPLFQVETGMINIEQLHLDIVRKDAQLGRL